MVFCWMRALLCADDFSMCGSIHHWIGAEIFHCQCSIGVIHWSSHAIPYAPYGSKVLELASAFNKLLFEYKLDERWLKLLNESPALFAIAAAAVLLLLSRNMQYTKKGYEFNGQSEIQYDKTWANVLSLKMKVEYINRLFIQHDYSLVLFLFVIVSFALDFAAVLLARWFSLWHNDATENFMVFDDRVIYGFCDCYDIVLNVHSSYSTVVKSLHDRCNNFLVIYN